MWKVDQVRLYKPQSPQSVANKFIRQNCIMLCTYRYIVYAYVKAYCTNIYVTVQEKTSLVHTSDFAG